MPDFLSLILKNSISKYKKENEPKVLFHLDYR